MAKFRFRSFEIEAWLFEGTLDGAPTWVLDKGVTAENNNLYIPRTSTNQEIPAGWWVFLASDTLYGMDPEDFDRQYEAVESSAVVSDTAPKPKTKKTKA
jgi:hypothetical protein